MELAAGKSSIPPLWDDGPDDTIQCLRDLEFFVIDSMRFVSILKPNPLERPGELENEKRYSPKLRGSQGNLWVWQFLYYRCHPSGTEGRYL